MMNKNVLLAALAAAVVGFLAGWVIYGMTPLMEFMMNHSKQYDGLWKGEADMKIEYYAVGNVLMGLMYAYVFGVLANINTLMGGLKTGAIIAFLICGSYDFMMAGGMNMMDKTGAAADIIAGTAIGALTGAVTGWVLGMGKKEG